MRRGDLDGTMTNKSIVPILLVPTALLLVPLVAMQFTREVAWGPLDFLVAWLLLAGTGFAYRLLARRARGFAFRAGAALAVLAPLLVVWGNLAVGFIGDEGNPANLLYGGVLFVEIAGVLLARFQPAGLARALGAAALVQAAVPAIALATGMSAVAPQEWIGNSVLVLPFAVAALLFHAAARQERERTAPTR